MKHKIRRIGPPENKKDKLQKALENRLFIAEEDLKKSNSRVNDELDYYGISEYLPSDITKKRNKDLNRVKELRRKMNNEI